MARRKSVRVGYVTLRKTKEVGCWQMDFRDPGTRRRARLRIKAASEKDARKQANHVSCEIAAGHSYMAAERFNPTVAGALTESIKASRANLTTRGDYTRLANLFVAWIEQARAGVKMWGDVTAKIVQDYLRHCQDELRLSDDQTRKRLFVVKAGSRFMSESYGFPDVARTVRMKRDQENPIERQEKDARKVLSTGNLLALLNHLRERRPDLFAIAALQGTCGLRAMEATNIREQDIDFRAGTLTVTETSCHKPKNRSSFRTIPVGPRVLAILRDWIDGLKVRHPEGFLFVGPRTNGAMTMWSYCDAIRRELDACHEATKIEAFDGYEPHWLRATFCSIMRARRVDYRLLQAYIGHAPGDVLGRHYEVIDRALLKAEIVPVSEGMWHKVGTEQKEECSQAS